MKNIKKIIFIVYLLLCSRTFVVAVSGITIQQQTSPLHNLLHIEVQLVNTVGETFDNVELSIQLPIEKLIYLRDDSINSGTKTISGPLSSKIIWATGNSSVSSKQYHFFAFSHQPGTFQITGTVTDNQGVLHTYTSNTQTLHTPYVKNEQFAIAKNGVLQFNAADLVITIDSVTTEVTQAIICPKPRYGTISPDSTTTSPFAFTYTPNQDFVGYDFFTVQALDSNQDCDGESIFVAVGIEDDQDSYVTFLRKLYQPEPEGKAPGAKDFTLSTPINSEISAYFIDYSLDLYHAKQPVVYTIDTAGVNYGTASVDESGVFTYTAGETIGYDTIPYRVTDADGRYCDAVITINVTSFS